MNDEVEKRTKAAKAAIQQAIDDESSVGLFVSHHLEELDPAYWTKYLGTPTPTPDQIVSLLELQSHWGDTEEDGLDHFDFTLPDDVTNYLLTITFNDAGEVESVGMES